MSSVLATNKNKSNYNSNEEIDVIPLIKDENIPFAIFSGYKRGGKL